MMDLADIRKKAQQQRQQEQAVARHAPVADELARTSRMEPNDIRLSMPVQALDASDNPLDRLFGTLGALPLATEESYLSDLADKVGGSEVAARRWVSFVLGHECYALDISCVEEIIKPRDITEIPRAPAHLLGIMSLRGVIVPVFDLKQRMGLGRVEPAPTARIIVCRQGEYLAGLLVEAISQVVPMTEEQIEPPPLLPDIDAELVVGVGRYRESFLILLNFEGIFNIEGMLD